MARATGWSAVNPRGLLWSAKAKGIGCSNCGQPFDFADHNSKRGFTADHPEALANGGRLLGQKLVPLCRECNARKGKTQTDSVILRPAT